MAKMTSGPYTPDEVELRDCYVRHMSDYAGEDDGQAKADAERGIAKIKAEALREASTAWKQGGWVKMLSHIGPNGGRWEASGFTGDWLLAQADRIEAEA